MKKLTIITVLAVAIIAGCNLQNSEERAQKEKHKLDSIAEADAIQAKKDSIKKFKLDSVAKIKNEAEQKRWEKTKAGKIQKKHPDWSKEDCENLANNKIWIGMSIHMVAFLRGLPNHKNVSNYGNGSEYQYCWDNYTPSCFYTKGDQIVYAYN